MNDQRRSGPTGHGHIAWHPAITLSKFASRSHQKGLVWVAALSLSLLLTGATWTVASPEVPGRPQVRPLALVGGTVHTVAGPDVEQGTVLIEKGRISAVSTEVKLPQDVEVVDCAGRHIYPGLIDAYSNLGLVEITSVRATRDQVETGTINPNVRAQVAFNPDSELIPVARSNGVLLAVTAPLGGLMTGTSSLMQLDGWTWEEMTLAPTTGIHVNWPRTNAISTLFTREKTATDTSKREQAITSLHDAIADARAYWQQRQARSPGQPDGIEFDARWEALIPVLDRQVPLIVHADELAQIQGAVAFAVRENLKLIIYGGYDAPRCAELLKTHDVPVIVAGVYRLPQRVSDPYDDPFTVPKRLHDLGIRYCISGAEDTWNLRNLPYHAGMAAAFGLPKEEALRAVTLYPAQILGVEKRVGSLETGRDATLIVTTGDVLEITTQVQSAYIQGRQVDLSDRHKRLYEKYQEKYRRLGIQAEQKSQ